MAPLRRYLRITPYSILEVRIYLDNPADLNRWLTHPQRPVLPDVLAAVKPFVLPKLKEENARAAGKKAGTGSTANKPKGKKGVRDIVTTDSFEVSIFLTELSTPHAVLVRSREFSAKDALDGRTGTKDAPMMVHGDEDEDVDVQLIRQESSDSNADQAVKLEDLPSAPDSDDEFPNSPAARNSNDDVVSVSSHGDDGEDDDEAPKKKLRLKTSYDGFSIYGRILCLVVKRRDQRTIVASSIVGQRNAQAKLNDSTSPQGDTEVQTTAQIQTPVIDQAHEGILEGWMRSTQVDSNNHGISGSNADIDSD